MVFDSVVTIFIPIINKTSAMDTIQIITSKGRYVNGEAVIYTGNFVILQNKEVKDGNLVTTHEIFPLENVIRVITIREAETRSFPEEKPQLITENVGSDCLCGENCKC